MEEIKIKLEEMRNSVKDLSTDNDYKYSDGWRDGIQFAIDKIEQMIQ